MSSLKLFVLLLIASLIAASACLALTSAWRILRTVGIAPLSVSFNGVRWILAAEPHAIDPRVPKRLRTLMILGRICGAAGFLIAAVGLALDGSRDGALVFGGLGVLAVGAVVISLKRYKDAA